MVVLCIMKGTKVLTLGAGREKDVDADGPLASYTHARYC